MKKIPLKFIITAVMACFPLSKSHADVSDCNISIAPTVIDYGDFTSTELEQSEFTQRNVSVNIFCPTPEKKLKLMVKQQHSVLSLSKTDKSKIILKLNSITLNGKSIDIQRHTQNLKNHENMIDSSFYLDNVVHNETSSENPLHIALNAEIKLIIPGKTLQIREELALDEKLVFTLKKTNFFGYR